MKINFSLPGLFLNKDKLNVKTPHLKQLPYDSFTYSGDKLDLNKYNSKINYERPVHYYCNTGYWVQRMKEKMLICPWKIHIYSDNIKDWQKVLNAIGPYLDDNDCCWKTVAEPKLIKDLNKQNQKGKAFTISPSSVDDFKKIASDIDYILKNNKLCIKNKKILGDRNLGDTGRIFYRYYMNSKELKDAILDLNLKDDYKFYRINYCSNRASANNAYLASDMTMDDDPFYNFKP